MLSEECVMDIMDDLKLGRSLTSQIKAILKIGGEDKLNLLPFVFKITSEQSSYYYSDCVEHVMKSISFSDKATLRLYMRPDVKEHIDNIKNWDDDIQISQDIDRIFNLEHPREKIAYLYHMSTKGSLYGQLNAGSRMCMLDEDPDFLFHMPFLASTTLKKGIRSLNTKDTPVTNHIRTSMQSLAVEANVKYILAMMEVGHGVTDLIENINWIVNNYPNHQRWQKLISKTECLSEIFT